MKTDREPTKMVSTKIYSTFQLSCCVFPANDTYSVHDVFNKLVLYIINWHRARAGNDEDTVNALSPYPFPENYKQFDLSSLPDITIGDAYNFKTLYLPELANWSFRSHEPDNQSEFEGKETASIVSGRSFITNIAVCEKPNHVALSYQCECQEPRNNAVDCKVYRPRFLKTICRDTGLIIKELPYTDIRYDYFSEQCIRITENSIAKRIASELIQNETRQLPVLFFTGRNSSEINIDDVAEGLMGCCHVYYVPNEQFNRLFRAKLNSDEIQTGDIVLYKKNDYTILNNEVAISEDKEEFLIRLIRNYPVRKKVFFYDTLFYREAKTEKYRDINSNDPSEILAQNRQLFDTIESNKTKFEEMGADIESLQDQLRKSRKEIQVLIRNNEEITGELNKTKKENEFNKDKNNKTNKNLILYRSIIQEILLFPTKKKDIGKWIRDNYSDQLLLLDKAEESLNRFDKPLDLKLLCSTIMYLNAYSLYRKNAITDEELDCYQFYNRWEITPCGIENVERYHEYEIDLSQYEVETKRAYLTHHLKSGKYSDNLIRIYISFNNELNKIIIGDLPDHLPTTRRSH